MSKFIPAIWTHPAAARCAYYVRPCLADMHRLHTIMPSRPSHHRRYAMATHAFAHEFQLLLQRPKCPDWGTRVQRSARDFWQLLSQRTPPSSSDVECFISFLMNDSDAFALTRLVVPELRQASNTIPEDSLQKHVVERLHDVRLEAIRKDTTEQAEHDDVLYQAEKDLHHDTQLHKARLLLQRSGNLQVEDEEAFRQWLASAPIRR